jgi:tetratricopeptide (TPR) repeat protein
MPKALADFEKAIAINPKFIGGYFGRGLIRSQENQFSEAVADFDKSLELDPNSAISYYYRGVARASLGDKESAKSDLRKSLELDPSLKSHVQAASEQLELEMFPVF